MVNLRDVRSDGRNLVGRGGDDDRLCGDHRRYLRGQVHGRLWLIDGDRRRLCLWCWKDDRSDDLAKGKGVSCTLSEGEGWH